jgi:hypothetical protein
MSNTEHATTSSTTSTGWLTTKRRITIAVGALVVVAIALMVLNQLVKSKSNENVSVADTFSSVEISSPGEITIVDGAMSINRKAEYVFKKPGSGAKVEDGVLKLESDCGGLRLGVCTVDYRVAFPADVPVKVQNSGGAVVVRSSKSDVHIVTESGNVTIEDSYGRITAETKSGSVKGTAVSSRNLNATTESGDVDLRFASSPNDVVSESESGDVRVVVPKSTTNYDVEAASQSGKTVTEITRDQSSPFKIRARSESGAVTVEAK